MNLLSFKNPMSMTRSLVGLAFDGTVMTASVVVPSESGRASVTRSMAITLDLDPMKDESELVGREIRTRLDEAGIRGRRCVVCIPLKWALTMQADVPDLAEEDRDSFVRLQAERGLPFALEDLALAFSLCRTPDGGRFATIAALPASRLAAIEKALKAAKLHPIGITFATTSLLPPTPAAPNAAIALSMSASGVEIEVRSSEGTLALRSLEEAVEQDAEGIVFDVESIARQLRITLGQFSQALRDSIASVQIYGSGAACRLAATELAPFLAPLHLAIEIADPTRDVTLDASSSIESVHPAAALAAAHWLGGTTPEFDFLPPRPTRFERIANLRSRRGILWLGGVAGAFALLVLGAFLIQYIYLSHLEGNWREIGPKAEEVENLQQMAREYRSWFDDSACALTIVRRLTESFPEEGSVWATAFGIRNLSQVTCSGRARSDADWLKVLENLRNTRGVRDLQVKSMQGGAPLSFSLGYTGGTGESDGV